MRRILASPAAARTRTHVLRRGRPDLDLRAAGTAVEAQHSKPARFGVLRAAYKYSNQLTAFSAPTTFEREQELPTPGTASPPMPTIPGVDTARCGPHSSTR
jgi:hypothetical protein